jgi:hypothetical protein
MSQKLRKRLALIVFLLLIVWILVWVKTLVLPIFTNPLGGTSDTHLMTVYGVGLLIMLFVLMMLIPSGKKTTIAHGSAHFATREELKTYGSLVANPRKERQAMSTALTAGGTLPPSKMHLGIYEKKLIVLDERMQESHVFLLAPTGVGKTSRVIVPALLREFGSRSLFVGVCLSMTPKANLLS